MSLYVKQVGPKDATAIVFLHGLGVSGWMWEDQISELQNDYHCLAIDLPGNGESYLAEWQSFSETAAQIAEIIRTQTNTGNAHIVGLSLGGYAALYLLNEYPEVINSMIVSGVTTRPFPRQWMWRSMVHLMSGAMKMGPLVNLSARMMQLPDEAVELYKRDIKRVRRETFHRVYDEVLAFSLPATLAHRSHRVLAVAGDSEADLIKNGLPDFPVLLPNATAMIVPDAHHAWNAEHPDLFTSMICAWVEVQPLPNALIQVNEEYASI